MTIVTVDPLEAWLAQAPPPCEATVQPGRPCENPAEWIVIFHTCCRTPRSLLCTRCLDELGKLPGLSCKTCGTAWFPAATAIHSGHPI